MEDAYEAYRDNGRPRLVRSAVLFLDVLGTQNPPGGDEQAHLERTHDAFVQAQSWGDSRRGANELTVSTWFTDNLVMACPVPELDGDAEDDGWPAVAANAIDLLMMYAALHQLTLGERGLFARGAITVGNFYADPEFAHGFAVDQTAKLEGKRVIYPRVILTPIAYRLLGHIDPHLGGDPHWTTGDDGLPFVDYLRYADMVTETDEQIDQVHRDHRDRILENLDAAGDDIGLLQKYGWLAAYHDDRAPAGAEVDQYRPTRRFPLLP